jgi:hypothetical protein
MVAARTAAMAFTRLVDRSFDAANPRTATRHLPRGALGVGEVFGLVVASCAAFIAATLLFLPNWLPLVLSAPVLAWLLAYSYTKRFTMLAHVWLGAALGMAPVAAWIAIRGPCAERRLVAWKKAIDGFFGSDATGSSASMQTRGGPRPRCPRPRATVHPRRPPRRHACPPVLPRRPVRELHLRGRHPRRGGG